MTTATEPVLPRLILWALALGFLGFGLAFTLWPLPLARMIDIPLPTANARIDFAATYGGFELGFGTFLMIAARRAGWRRIGLLAAGWALAGFAVVRLASIALAAGTPGMVIYLALAMEVPGAALAFWAAKSIRQ